MLCMKYMKKVLELTKIDAKIYSKTCPINMLSEIHLIQRGLAYLAPRWQELQESNSAPVSGRSFPLLVP